MILNNNFVQNFNFAFAVFENFWKFLEIFLEFFKLQNFQTHNTKVIVKDQKVNNAVTYTCKLQV
jgi:hypothetical protein